MFPTQLTSATLPRGIRNNNPGNIRRNTIRWQRMRAEQTDNDFVQFVDPKYGFRAMTRILRNYQRRGLLTLREMINTYAPAHENDSDAYTRFVANRLQVNPDQELDLERHLFPLLKAIAVFENGLRFESHYRNSTINAGIALA